jgi:ATP-dependent RNA helicase SUPV3L1/SUV3
VIFESTIKSNGTNYVPLQISEVKQIAGRAGRYKTAHQAATTDSAETSAADSAVDSAVGLGDKKPEPQTVGWVTTLDEVDHAHLKMGMKREPEEIKSAGLFPPSLIVERFANYFPPGTPFSYIMLRLHEISELHPRFHLCALKDQLAIADVIHVIKNLSIQDRIMICAAPINMRDQGERNFLRALAECIADGKSGSLLDLETLPLNVMDQPPNGTRKYLYDLEQLHKMLVCYLWLSYRFPNVFTTRTLANYTKKLVEDQIEKHLTEFSQIEQTRIRQRKEREQARKRMEEEPEEAVIEQMEGQNQIPAPPGMPEEAKDIVNDPELAAEKEPEPDDEGSYPDDLPATSRLETITEEHQHRVNKLSDEVGVLPKSRMEANGTEATQSGA